MPPLLCFVGRRNTHFLRGVQMGAHVINGKNMVSTTLKQNDNNFSVFLVLGYINFAKTFLSSISWKSGCYSGVHRLKAKIFVSLKLGC
jgi:hypothetical protein